MKELNNILIVEDNKLEIKKITDMLQLIKAIDAELHIASSVQEAFEIFKNHDIDFIILDLNLKQAQGIEILRNFGDIIHKIPFIVLSEIEDESIAIQALLNGAEDYIIKSELTYKTLQRSLRHSLEHFRNKEQYFMKMFMHHSAIKLIIDPKNDGRIILGNNAAVDFYSYSHEELGKMKITDLNVLPPDETKKHMQSVENHNQEIFEFQHKLFDGSIRDVLVYSSPITIEGRILLYSIIRDITEEKRLQDALKESEAKYRTVVENTSDWIWEIDVKGNFTYVSPQVKKILGYEAEELIGKNAFDLMSDEEAKRVKAVYSKYILNKSSFKEMINVNLHKNGNEVILESSGEPFFDNKGNLIGYRGIDRDITDRKKIEKALKESEANFKSIIENSANLFYKHDPNHKITFLSSQIKDLLGYEVEEAKRNWTEFLTDNPVNEIGYSNTVKAIETGEKQDAYTLELKHKDGKKIWVEVRENPIVKNGKTIEIVGVLVDITDRKKAEKALKESLIDLELAQQIANIGNWQFDPEIGILVWSKAVYSIYERDPALGPPHIDEYTTMILNPKSTI